jgi:hypothetical protein
MGGIPFIKEGNTPLSKEESDASSSEKNYIPSGLLEMLFIIPFAPWRRIKGLNSFVIVITYISI